MTASNSAAFKNASFEVNGKESPVHTLNRFTFGGRRQYRNAFDNGDAYTPAPKPPTPPDPALMIEGPIRSSSPLMIEAPISNQNKPVDMPLGIGKPPRILGITGERVKGLPLYER